jgi:predicted aspartyl protease
MLAKDRCIHGLAFVDPNGSVILMVTNALETDGKATAVFSNGMDGHFECKGVLGSVDARLTISGGAGSFALSIPARETLVFEIPRLKWKGH